MTLNTKDERPGFKNLVASILLFTLIVALAFLWIKNNIPASEEVHEQATSTPKVVSQTFPDVSSSVVVKTESIDKKLFPSGNKPVTYLVDVTGTYPTNTPFAEVTKKHVTEFVAGFLSDYPKRESVVTSYGVYADSEVTYSFGKKLLSYLYADSRFDGGAHGNTSFASETFDMNGTKYNLGDLFIPNSDYLGVISRLATAHFTKDADINFDPNDTTWGGGLSPKSENFSTFTISGDKIIFQFQSYQIGPYSDGMPTFELSVKNPEISSIIKTEIF